MTQQFSALRALRARWQHLMLPAFTALLLTSPSAQAAPGDLDGSFGAGGVVSTDVGPDIRRDTAAKVLIQPDGKIVAAGTCDNDRRSPDKTEQCLARYHPDGSLDLSFGVGGKVHGTVGFNGGFGYERGNSSIADAALLKDGKILVAGTCMLLPPNGPLTYPSCLSRYHANGSLDESFGNQGIASGPGGAFTAIAVQNDDKIIAASTCSPFPYSSGDTFCLARYHPDGSLDLSFGEAGKVNILITAESYAPTIAHTVAIQPDGKILVGGTRVEYTSRYPLILFCLARYNADGSLDTTFGENGIVLGDFHGTIYDLALQQDGKIVAVGNGALARYNANGSLDTSFSGDGLVTEYASGGSAVAIQQNGKIIALGGVHWVNWVHGNTFVLLRYLPDGTPDHSFGAEGVIAAPVGARESFLGGDAQSAGGYSLAIQADGKIVAAGSLAIADTDRQDFVVARYFGDPTNRAPLCNAVTADMTVLSTPNHAWQLITLAGATDPDGDALTLQITGVTQDEPVRGTGAGDTAPDAKAGPAGHQVYLRGERSGQGDGRVYRIAFTVSDAKGGTCSGTGYGDGTVKVAVPHSQNGQAAVDSGAVFNSFGL